MGDQSLTPPFRGTTRFSVIRKLGAGGMGVVYEAVDRETGGRIALKTLREAGGAEELLRLKNEFRSLADLSHRTLVRILTHFLLPARSSV